jgi:hypothetical protein
MLALDDAVYERLVGSASLMALTADYGGGKAVFTGGSASGSGASRTTSAATPIPVGDPLPRIVVSGAYNDSDGLFTAKNAVGRQWAFDIFVYDRVQAGPAVVEQMAEIIRSLFHREGGGAVGVDGYGVMVASAVGPVVAPTDDTLYGRAVMVTLSAAA